MAVKAAAPKRVRRKQSNSPTKLFKVLLLWAAIVGAVGAALQTQYTFTIQSPLRVHLQWPIVMAPRLSTEQSGEAQADQFGHRLTAFQQYACNKFGLRVESPWQSNAPRIRVEIAVSTTTTPMAHSTGAISKSTRSI